jgi:hypothetical protein
MSGMWWRRKARPCWATVRVRRRTSLQETTRKAAGRTRRCRATATRNGRARIRPARVNSPGVAAPLRFFRRRAVLNLGSRMLCPHCAGNAWQRRIVTGSGALAVCHPRPDVDRSRAADCQGDSPPPPRNPIRRPRGHDGDGMCDNNAGLWRLQRETLPAATLVLDW